MAGPHDWDWASPTTATTPVSTGTPNFGPPGTGGANQPPPPNNPREEAIMAAATANMPTPILPVTQTKTLPEDSDFGGYKTAQQQAAASMMDAGQVAGNLAFGLYDKSPVQYPDRPDDLPTSLSDYTDEQLAWHDAIIGADDPAEIGGFQYDLPENVYYSTYGPETQAYAHGSNPYDDQLIGDTGYVEIEPGEGVPGYTRDENGNLVWLGLEGASRYHGWNPWESGGQGGGGGDSWDDRDLLAERRAWQEGLWYGPKIAQQKNMEAQGFFNTLGSKIRNPFLEAVGETLAINPEGRSGLYGKTMFHPKMRKPWGLEQEYATGVRTPLYQNRARGGIMSVWADRR